MKKIREFSTGKCAGMRVASNDVRTTEQRGEMRMELSGGVASGDVKVTEQRGEMRMVTRIEKWMRMGTEMGVALMMLMVMAMGASVSSCSSGDGEEDEVYVPVESEFARIVKVRPVYQLSYSYGYNISSFYLLSNPIEGKSKIDYYGVSIHVKTPANEKWNGRYEVEQVDGSVWGWEKPWMKEKMTHELSTWTNNQPVKGAWIEVRTLDKGDEYGRKKFSVKLHVDEMTEKNGDYARDVNISFTGRDVGSMLVN